MKVFAIYDCKAEAYLQPFFCVNRAVALRNFGAAAQDEGTQFARHAADYTLFEIGEWDEFNGKLVPAGVNVALGTALEYRSSEGVKETGVVHLVGEDSK